MAVLNVIVERPPADVWDVLADGWAYAEWVIGTESVQQVDPEWPALGSSIRYRVRLGPFCFEDKTTVRYMERGRHLQLEAHAPPFGSARVAIEILSWGETQSVVTLDEHPLRGPAARFHSAPADILLRLRIRAMARKLARLVVDRHPMSGQ